jgi:hypothetical protein
MANRKSKKRTIFELTIPTWILWAVVVSFVYAVSLFIAYDVGKKNSRLNEGAFKVKQEKRGKSDPVEVLFFIPPEKVHYQARFNFTFDNEEILRALRNREKLDTVIAGAKTNIEVFLRLMKWVRAQWSPGRPDPYPPIDAVVILDKIREGVTGGFCAQYCVVLVQCLQSFGYKARYVTIKRHEVTEVWSPRLSKWVMLDPLYELYISKGVNPLSVLEIHNMVLRGEQDMEIHAKKHPGDLREYLSRYERFAVWSKNDHVSSPINFFDIERYKIYFLDDPNEQMAVPLGSLYTPFPEDLYLNPFTRQMRRSQ